MSHLNRQQHGLGLSYRSSGMPLQAPPPPTMKDMHLPHKTNAGRHARYGRSRSRSRSPARRSTGSRSRHDDPRSNSRGEPRHSSRRSRSGSPRNKTSSGVIKEEPTSSSSYPTYIGSADDSHNRLGSHSQQQQLANDNTIVRTILNAESVKIPRRENEGLRPIFDREELREAIKRRMETGDNEQNPSEQRVVAIIREPLPMAQQYMQQMQQDIIPILPQYMNMPVSEQMIQPQPQIPQARFETASGVTYSFPKDRSRSPTRLEPRAEKESRRPDKRDDRRIRRPSPDVDRHRPGHRRGTRSRSQSPVARVERVRYAASFALSSSRSPEREGLDEGNNLPWNDLRQCLNVHRNVRIQLARAYAAENPDRHARGRGIVFGIRRPAIPNRGPWQHDMYGREDDAKEQTFGGGSRGRHLHRGGRRD